MMKATCYRLSKYIAILITYKFERSDLEAIKYDKNESSNKTAKLSHANAGVEMDNS
jgi:hypothetical protein